MIPFLGPCDRFPPVDSARQDLGGLLAVGGDLSAERLLEAYRQGIFPWGSIKGQVLWYCPDPRMVHFPEEIRLSRSLRQTLRRQDYEIRLDSNFPGVIAACAATPRPGQDGTWITREMQSAYRRLHELGWAHSVETWVNGQLVGGLYGLAIGRAFFGESMFSHRRDASKIAFAHLARYLSQRGFGMIDCQMYTAHLASLGAREIPRQAFTMRLSALLAQAKESSRWPTDDARYDWS